MKIRAPILGFSFGIALLISVAAQADDPMMPASGSSLIDLGGEVVTAGLAGGMADPVPLFVGPTGPAIFVMDTSAISGMDTDLGSQLSATVKKGFEPPQARTLYGPRH